MEFRIAPLIIVMLNTLYLSYCIYNIADTNIKQILIGFGTVALAYGASRSHHYYSKQFLRAFYSIVIVDLVLATYLIYYYLKM